MTESRGSNVEQRRRNVSKHRDQAHFVLSHDLTGTGDG
jgi:hypothetical protein